MGMCNEKFIRNVYKLDGLLLVDRVTYSHRAPLNNEQRQEITASQSGQIVTVPADIHSVSLSTPVWIVKHIHTWLPLLLIITKLADNNKIKYSQAVEKFLRYSALKSFICI